MKIITPTNLLDAMLIYSNVAEAQPPEPTEYNDGTGYTIGQQAAVVLGTDTENNLITHGIYESTFDGTNTDNDPTTQVDKTYWKFVGSTVRWAMFNEILQNRTVQTIARDDGLTLPSGSGNYANSPDIGFPLEKMTVVGKITATDFASADQVIFSKWTSSGNERSVLIGFTATGELEILTSPTGTSGAKITYESTEIPPFTNTEEAWLKIEFDGDDGVNSSATFYYSLQAVDGEGLVVWIPLGDPVLSTQTSIYNSTALLELGSKDVGTQDVFEGSIQQLTIYDGIDEDTRTLISDYNRIDVVSGGTSTSWRTGQVWTDQGSAAFAQDISGIVTDIDIGSLNNSIALMNLSATTAQIIGKDSVEGEIYNESFSLQSTLGISGMYAWLFKALTFDINLVVLNLPAFLNAEYRIIITGAETAACGAAVIGNEFDLGATQYDARYGLESYSVKETDIVTGAVTISSGTFRSIADVEVKTNADNFSIVLDTLTGLVDTPVVWIGSEFVSGMIQYGYYKSFTEIYSNFSEATCLLEIEGL